MQAINNKEYTIGHFTSDVKQEGFVGYEIVTGRIVKIGKLSIELQLKIEGKYRDAYALLFYKDLNESLNYNDSGFLGISSLPLYVGKEMEIAVMIENEYKGSGFHRGKALNENGLFYDMNKVESDMDDIKDIIDDKGVFFTRGVVIRKERKINRLNNESIEYKNLFDVLNYLNVYANNLPGHQYRAIQSLINPYKKFLETGKSSSYSVAKTAPTIINLLNYHNKVRIGSTETLIKNFEKVTALMIANEVQTFISLIDYPGVNMAINDTNSSVGDVINVKITGITEEGKLRGSRFGGKSIISTAHETPYPIMTRDEDNTGIIEGLSNSRKNVLLSNFLIPSDYESFDIYEDYIDDLTYLVEESDLYTPIIIFNKGNLEEYYIYNYNAYSYMRVNDMERVLSYKYSQSYIGFLDAVMSLQFKNYIAPLKFSINETREEFKAIDCYNRSEIAIPSTGKILYIEEGRNTIYDFISHLMLYSSLNNKFVSIEKRKVETRRGSLEVMYINIKTPGQPNSTITIYLNEMAIQRNLITIENGSTVIKKSQKYYLTDDITEDTLLNDGFSSDDCTTVLSIKFLLSNLLDEQDE